MQRGDVLVLTATLLWAVEVIIAKQLLSELAPATVSLIRMGVGSVVLVAYLVVVGATGDLFSLSAAQLGWVALTGLLLAGYVGTWMTALGRARAVDVTSVLVASTVVTALLSAAAGAAVLAAQAAGLVLISAGVVIIIWVNGRRAFG
jgi:drug/metabolite transporter (DMT)-like permease